MPKRKILIVDDSKAMRLIVRRAVRQAGFEDVEVTEATNGQEALSALQSTPVDLVISDWNMPEMSGIELLNQLTARGLKVKLGFITTEGTPEMRAVAATAGAVFLIAKPFTPEQVQQIVGPFLA
ncbi:MAG TPA: response regulator [Polyangiaceae bacterium]|jgi:two-component system chemotaxis response regulator CheY|nr:response regulator [Polyangiaceae bacterium]